MECQKEKNLKQCPCTWPNCPRKRICCECIRHHLSQNELPACCFALISEEAEKSYDRSIGNFVEGWLKKH